MFFIFGTDAKVVQLGTVAGPGCAQCGSAGPLSLCKCYNYLHLFFLPIFRFHVKYIATCPGCASVFAVSPEAGKALEKGQLRTLSPGDLTLLRSSSSCRCPRCSAVNPAGSSYCNHCGSTLS